MRAMSAATPEALADLLEISSQIEGVVIVGADGAEAAAGIGDDRAGPFALAAQHLLSAAGSERDVEVAHVEVDLAAGSVFVVREGGATIAAVATAAPTSGLVLYDLRACLRRLAAEAPAPKKRLRKEESADATA